MSEEQATPPAIKCTHPWAVGERYGDPIGPERQVELQGVREAWAAESDHDERKGPFEGVGLTGADVYWLAERVRKVDAFHTIPDLHLETLYVNTEGVSQLYALPVLPYGRQRARNPVRTGHM